MDPSKVRYDEVEHAQDKPYLMTEAALSSGREVEYLY